MKVIECMDEKRILKVINEIFPTASPAFTAYDVYFLAVLDDEDVGFLHLILEEKRVLLQGVGVRENFRGKGIGGKLMDVAINYAEKGGEEILLKVKPDNIPALNLYAKKGFVIKKLRNSYILQRKRHN